jgi:hypothetical protein
MPTRDEEDPAVVTMHSNSTTVSDAEPPVRRRLRSRTSSNLNPDEVVRTPPPQQRATTPNSNGSSNNSSSMDEDDDDDDMEEGDDSHHSDHLDSPSHMGGILWDRNQIHAASNNNNMNNMVMNASLADLQEEREWTRRRSSACVLLAIFVLLRLWMEALAEGDWGLLLLCLAGTSWTARWIRYMREREEELDRQITAAIHSMESGGNGSMESGGDGRFTLDRNELRLLSFQAQLALAIMESQRQMMQGGYGHPDGEHGTSVGISEEGKSRWERFRFQLDAKKGDYGSVSQKDGCEDGPHCSICLGEYEDEEELVKLPCQHIYHDECITSWTSNHTKCPLCNYDLEVAAEESV